jgi:hypothetical protein
VAARRVIMDARAAETPGEPAQQVGRHPTFIEKPILAYVAQRLPQPPLAPFGGDVGTPLFIGVDGFF